MGRKKQSSRVRRAEARSRQERSAKWMYIALALLAVVIVGAGAGLLLARGRGTDPTASKPQLASSSQLPAWVRTSPPVVQEAYRYASANPQTLAKIPCYCGCGNVGHESSLNCFVKQFNSDGSIVFSDHALGCGICVDIARDVMRLTGEGKSLAEIRTYVDRQYSKFGSPTNTEPVGQ